MQGNTAPAPIQWRMWAIYSDGSRSLVDLLDWETGYDGTAQQAWRYMWSVFRAWNNPGGIASIGADRIELETVRS